MFGIEWSTATGASFSVVVTALIAAAITDIREFKVYNALTFPLVIGGVLVSAMAPWGQGLESSLTGAAIGFGLLFLPFLTGGIGAGDLKLMAGVGAWLGPHTTLLIFVVSGLAAGVYAVVAMTLHGSFREHMLRLRVMYYQIVSLSRYMGSEDRVESYLNRADRRSRVMPFAAIMCFGTLLLLCLLITGS